MIRSEKNMEKRPFLDEKTEPTEEKLKKS